MAASAPGKGHYVWLEEVRAAYFTHCVDGGVEVSDQWSWIVLSSSTLFSCDNSPYSHYLCFILCNPNMTDSSKYRPFISFLETPTSLTCLDILRSFFFAIISPAFLALYPIVPYVHTVHSFSRYLVGIKPLSLTDVVLYSHAIHDAEINRVHILTC